MEADREYGAQKEKDPAVLRHWRSWDSWYSWGTPVGIGAGWFLFMVGTGLGLFLMSLA